jgi:cytochrome c oxidase subunit 1
MVLPAMGVISELVAAFCRKQIFGYTFVAFASLGIAVLGFLVWAITCSSPASRCTRR